MTQATLDPNTAVLEDVTEEEVAAVKRILRAMLAVREAPEGTDFPALVALAGLSPKEDFTGRDLSGLDLRGCDMTAFDLTDCDLSGAEIDERTQFNDTLPVEIRVGLPSGKGSSGEKEDKASPEAQRIIDEAIAKELGKKVENLTESDRTAVVRLVLSYTRLTDLSPLAALTGLQSLNLRLTKVTDLSPLAALTGLQRLYLSRTPVTDLSPLAALTGLQRLDLKGTPVTDLSPLAALTGLQSLDLRGTKVTNLSPVEHIKGLRIHRP